jgi:hypothetical protein
VNKKDAGKSYLPHECGQSRAVARFLGLYDDTSGNPSKAYSLSMGGTLFNAGVNFCDLGKMSMDLSEISRKTFVFNPPRRVPYPSEKRVRQKIETIW